MKLGVITDTHENKNVILKAISVFNESQVDLVVHAGDMIAPFTGALFSELKCPFKFHLGNNDGEILFLKTKVEEFGGEFNKYDFTFELDGKSFLVQHEPQNTEAIAKSGLHDCIIYGHTHDVDVRTVGKTLILNPGEACTWLRGIANIALLDTKSMSPELINLL